MHVRSAEVTDAEEILDIYSYYVIHTAITFDYEVPELEEFADHIADVLEDYPFLVLEDEGAIQGYAYAGPLKDRAAYARSCETSIYVRNNARRKGYGRILYQELEKDLSELGILNLYACIASPIEQDDCLTRDSEFFHTRLGYTLAGTFHQCGYKFGRWYDVIWMEKMIGHHVPDQIDLRLLRRILT